jgi:hypothetical protein
LNLAHEKAHFDLAIERSEHFLTLYDLISNTRRRKMRSDWGKKFKKFMGWNEADKIYRIDSKYGFIIVKNPPVNLTEERFKHDYASELLRSAIVSSVSALDKYFHDRTLNMVFSNLNGPK